MSNLQQFPAMKNLPAFSTRNVLNRFLGTVSVGLFALLALGVSPTQAATFIKANNASTLDGVTAGAYIQDKDNGIPTTTQSPGINDIVVWDTYVGTTTISSGTLGLFGAGTLGSVDASINILPGAALDVSNIILAKSSTASITLAAPAFVVVTT